MRASHVASAALSFAFACNAILDNDPRHLEDSRGSGGANGGTSPEGGATAEGGTTSQGGARGDGGSPTTEGGSGGQGGTTAQGGGALEAGTDSGGESGGPTAGAGGGAPICETPCSLANATSACQAGICVVTGCKAGFLDTNKLAADGCEAGDVPGNALALWFRTDAGLSLNGDQVTAWVDQSAAHVTASAASAAAMPKRVQPASGPAMVEFDGADDGLKMPEGFANFTGTTFFAVAQAYTVPDDNCAGILSFSNGNDGDDIEYGRHKTNLLYYEVLGDWVEGAPNAFEANKKLLVAITQNGAGAVELRINGVINSSPKTINLPKAVVRRQNYLGRDTYTACPQAYKGLLGELILFTRGVDSGEYARIQAYLSTKWSIPVP